MKTIEELKQSIIDALGEVDPAKLSLFDMNSYIQAVKTVSEITPKGYAEQLSEMMSTISTGFNDRYKTPTLNDLKKGGDK